MDGIKKKYRHNEWPFLLGYIFIPPGLTEDTRDKFVVTCFRKKQVSVIFRDGGVAHQCPISKSKIKDINFPLEFGEVGSPVLCYIEPYYGVPMIVEVYEKDNDIETSREFEKIFKAFNGNNLSEIKLKGDNGEIDLNVDSDSENGGKIVLNIKNNSRTGKLTIKVLGEADIYTSAKCSIYSNSELDLRVENLDNDTSSSINVKGSEIIFNDNVLDSFMANINKLVDRINLSEDKVNEIIGSIRDSWVPVAMDGGAALKTLFATVQDLQNTEVDDIKDEKIKN